jgi:excisionase family DNA binding protein
MMTTYTVYTCLDTAGDPLYVGCTFDWPARSKAHKKQRSWWPQVKSFQFEHFDTAASASAREQELIRELEPPMNSPGPARGVYRKEGVDSTRNGALGIAAAARRIGVHQGTIARWMEAGHVSYMQIGSIRRIRVSEIDRLLREVPATNPIRVTGDE